MRAGRLSEGVRVVAESFGFDLAQPPLFLLQAIRLKVRCQNEEARRSALTAMNIAMWSHGAKMDYWDIVGHLYPPSEVEAHRIRKAEAEELSREQDLIEKLKAIHVEGTK